MGPDGAVPAAGGKAWLSGWLRLPTKGDRSVFLTLGRTSSHQGRGFCRSPEPRLGSSCTVTAWLCIQCKRTANWLCCSDFLLQIWGDHGAQGPKSQLAGAARRSRGLWAPLGPPPSALAGCPWRRKVLKGQWPTTKQQLPTTLSK